jgi:hypothetical protein
MKAAQAKHNEALGMRVTLHKPSAFRAVPTQPRCPTIEMCRDKLPAGEEIE